MPAINNDALIEEGRDVITSVSPDVIPGRPTPERITAQGKLVKKDGSYFLDIQGSLVKIVFQSEEELDQKEGQVITVDATQNGFTLVNAVLEQTGLVDNSPGDFSAKIATIRQEFAAVINIIPDVRKKLAEIDGVIKVRPGYKFDKGRITDKIAVVIEVERKKDKASLSPKQLLPAQYGHIPVEV
ncbi:MAG: hypothetical protein J7527_06200, partial [Chitinophagaceae bacterium]|nr:hypothetical protein [Chitinophagaceae bacterium]